MAFTLKKSARLKSRKQIELLFAERNSVKSYPLRAFWRLDQEVERSVPVQAGFSVSKRLFKKAVDRNYFKRLLREAYRLHQAPLNAFFEAQVGHLDIMFVYTTKERLTFAEIETKMIKAIQRLLHELQKKAPHATNDK
jgi:ribonuclease P protein component